MKAILAATIVLGLLGGHAFGQADQVKRRAKELVNQNNVRQGNLQQGQPAPPAAPNASQPATATPTTTQQSIARIQADLAGFKPGTAVTAQQKQQLTKDIAVACRGTKPMLPSVTSFVNDLAAALTDKPLDAANQARLARDIESVLNSASLSTTQFDAIIADVQAILQVGGAKRSLAVAAANRLKTIGSEVRRGAAP